MASESATEEYGADSIRALEGLSPIRLRPGMYIGSTDKSGLLHCLWEAVDNCVDEAMGGFADLVEVILNQDNSVTVVDNGRGIPVEPQKQGIYKGMPTVEMVLTVIHAGGKFGDGAYSFSGGLHGVGISVVNALSRWTHVDIQRDGQNHHIEFGAVDEVINGKPDVRPGIVTAPLVSSGRIAKDRTGTSVTFLPDDRVFSTTEWDYSVIARRLRQNAFLNAGLTLQLTDNRSGHETPTVTYHYPNGLFDFMKEITEDRVAGYEDKSKADRIFPKAPISMEGVDKDVNGEWEMCFAWFPDSTYRVHAFANGIETKWGGTHVKGYENVLTSMMNRYAKQDHIGLLTEKDGNLEALDVRSGLTMIVSVKVKEPQFVGQTKDELSNAETGTMVRQGFSDKFWNWMQENPVEIKAILDRAIGEMRLRRKLAADAENERNKMEKRGSSARADPLPEKLVDATCKDRSLAELYVVEGNSAAGPGKRTRDRETQGILPIRGKIINVLNAPDAQVNNNKEVQGIIAALGAGSQDLFDLSASRYGKVIIATDADVDGAHITCLLLSLFLWAARPFVEAGNLYIARPPLFSVDAGKKGKFYAGTIEERDRLIEQYPNADVGRFKGLGEMDDDDFKPVAMDPATRIIVRVTVDDIEDALATASDLMGSDSTPKWELLQREFDLAAAISG